MNFIATRDAILAIGIWHAFLCVSDVSSVDALNIVDCLTVHFRLVILLNLLSAVWRFDA